MAEDRAREGQFEQKLLLAMAEGQAEVLEGTSYFYPLDTA